MAGKTGNSRRRSWPVWILVVAALALALAGHVSAALVLAGAAAAVEFGAAIAAAAGARFRRRPACYAIAAERVETDAQGPSKGEVLRSWVLLF